MRVYQIINHHYIHHLPLIKGNSDEKMINFLLNKRYHEIQQIHSENKRKLNIHSIFMIQQNSFKNIYTYNKQLKERKH